MEADWKEVENPKDYLLVPPLPTGQQEPESQQQQPKRRRYRVPRSCDRCRTSKIKCVFEDGRCVGCATARVPCTFANPGSLKLRPPTQKDVEHLQARIRSLERLIHAIDPALDLSSLPEPIEPPQTNSKADTHERSAPSFSQSGKPPQSFLNTLDHQPAPALSSLSFPSRFNLNPSAGHVLFSLANVDDFSPVDKIFHQESTKQYLGHRDFYPEPELEQSLMELYFKNVNPCLPILHPATFVQDLQSGLSRTSDSFRGLCMSMMAVSSRFSQDPRVFLDLEDNPQPAAGLRYGIIVGLRLFQPITAPPNLHDLQAILVLVIHLLGTTGPDSAWEVVGYGLQRAQEAGAHLEKSPNWTSCPLQDHLRRKTFQLLYELDSRLSAALGKPPNMQESDFDVLPYDLDFEKSIGTFTNPFCPSSSESGEALEESKVRDELGLFYWTLKSSFGGLKNLLALMDLMNARRDSYPVAKLSSCIERLIDRLDTSTTKCYAQIAQKFRAHEPGAVNVTDSQLTCCVDAITWYHEFRLLTHKILFNYKGGKHDSGEGSKTTSNSDNSNTNQEEIPKANTINRHAEICIESARMILSLINRLYERNLLEFGFYWIPLRLTNALIILIISLKKLRKIMSPVERNLRYYEVLLGIQILNALAPSTFLARKCSRIISRFQKSLLHQDHENKSKKSSFSSPPTLVSSASASSPPEASSSPLSEDTYPTNKQDKSTESKIDPQDFNSAPFFCQPAGSSVNDNHNTIHHQDLSQIFL